MFTREEWNQIVGAKGKWVTLEKAGCLEYMTRAYGPSYRTCTNHYRVRHLGNKLIQVQAWSRTSQPRAARCAGAGSAAD